MKVGTKVNVRTFRADGTRGSEKATVTRVKAAWLPLPAGYVPVRFGADRAVLLVHASHIA